MARTAEATERSIIDAAYRLFRRSGYHRVSLDHIATEAAITKRTLYNHFDSKDTLLAAILEAQSAEALTEFQTFGADLPDTPGELVDGLFRALAEWSSTPRWAGAGYTRAVVELADLPGHPAHAIARRHKADMERHLAVLLSRAGVADAARVARDIQIVVEGAMLMILVHRDGAYAERAAVIARALLDRDAPVRTSPVPS